MSNITESISFAIQDTWVICKRNLVRYRRIPQLLFFSTIQPIMFLLLFTFVFGGALSGVDANYINYLLPGILMQSALFGSLQTGVGLADDMTKGIIDRFRSLPMAPLAVLAGRTVSDAMRNAFVVTVMLIVGRIIGFNPTGGLLGVLGAAMLAVVFGFAFSWVSAAIGLAVKNSETAQVAGFVWVFPLVYISSAYVPVNTLPPVLKAIATYSPITMTIDAVRGLTSGVNAFPDVWYALLWIVGIFLVASVIAVRLYQKQS